MRFTSIFITLMLFAEPVFARGSHPGNRIGAGIFAIVLTWTFIKWLYGLAFPPEPEPKRICDSKILEDADKRAAAFNARIASGDFKYKKR